MNRYIWLCGALWCSTFIFAQQPISLLIIDTQSKDPYYYRNLIMLANSVGFKTDYKNLYDLLENADINHYQALLFMLSPAMINMNVPQRIFNAVYSMFPINPAYIIPHYCLQVLRLFARHTNKAIGLILPGNIKYSEQLKQRAHQVIYEIGRFEHLTCPTQSLLDNFLEHSMHADSATGILFGTSLLNQSPTVPTSFATPSTHEALLLPLQTHHYQQDVQKTFPTGLLICHPRHNIYFISKSSVFDFADVAENFLKNPFSITDRNELLKAAQETLHAFHDAITRQKLPTTLAPVHFPKQLTIDYLHHKKRYITAQQQQFINPDLYDWIFNRSIACGWFDPYDFFAHEDQVHKIQKLLATTKPENIEQYALARGITIIYDGNFQLVWFECLPEWYLNPHGLRNAHKDEYIRRIKQIGHTLRTFFKERNKPLPKIFIGFNLTSNFKSYPVTNPVQSLTGTVYSKIPSPLDFCHFWQPELLDVFDEFVAIFKEHLPIDGVFFDFEMYHAQDQTGSYTDLMDFSDLAWHIYCDQTNTINAYTIKSVQQRIAYLQQHKKFKEYFCILQEVSRTIGSTIKQHMRKQLPHLLFAAYAPTLPSCWFYRGIMAGLSSPSEPLILATFNTDYASHYGWLAHHHIHVLHGTAIMLSKLQKPSDFNVINAQLKHHVFVWYNRPSRMIYAYNQDELNTVWWGIEASPLDSKKLMKGIRKQHQINSICN